MTDFVLDVYGKYSREELVTKCRQHVRRNGELLHKIELLRATVDVFVAVFEGDKRLEALAMVDGATKAAVDRHSSPSRDDTGVKNEV